jgi:ADP-ribose pyrophosphatase YjhB (NUDIX family)
MLVIFQRFFYYLTCGKFPPPFVSSVAVIRKANTILLIDRNDGLGLSLPGGFVGLREKTEVAAKREVYEETGLNVKINEIITVLSGVRKGTRVFSTDIVYSASIVGDERTRDSFEGKCKWIHIDMLDQYNIALDYGELLRRL